MMNSNLTSLQRLSLAVLTPLLGMTFSLNVLAAAPQATGKTIEKSQKIPMTIRRLGQAISSEQQILSRARVAYKKSNFKTALAEYSKIPTSSDRWPIAREEMAWTSFRMKEYQLASAQVRSLTNDYLKTQIDLEPYLLQAIVNLYSCDYNAVFTTLSETKRQMADYVSGIESLAKKITNEAQVNAIDYMMSQKTFEGLEPEAFHALPRRFYLDRQAAAAIKSANRQLLTQRLVTLAVAANERNHKILQHLHLVEVEAIQRAFIPNQFGGKKLTAVPNEKDLMIFNGDDELWADEVDKTQADLFTCDSKTGRTL